jgi:hypothetical protein
MFAWFRKQASHSDVKYLALRPSTPTRPNPDGTECAALAARLGTDPYFGQEPCWRCGHIVCWPGYPCDICRLTVALLGDPKPKDTP